MIDIKELKTRYDEIKKNIGKKSYLLSYDPLLEPSTLNVVVNKYLFL